MHRSVHPAQPIRAAAASRPRFAPAVWLALAAWLALPGGALAQMSLRMDLLAHEDPVPGGRGAYAACWGYTAPDGTQLALIGTVGSTEIFDVTNPRQTRNVATIPGPPSQWREMQTWSHYAYIVAEQGANGVQIVDLGNPHSPQYVGSFDSTASKAHTIHIADGFAYLNGTNNGWRILDLSDPVHPRDVGGWDDRYVHDCYVRGNLAYLSNIQDDGFTILDLSDKAHPTEIAYVTYDGASAHNCWASDDGDYLFTTDEIPGGHLRVFDISNPSGVVEIGGWSANPQASIHNVVVRGDSAYVAYYTEGVHVLDVSRPGAVRQVAFYDTYPGVSGGFNGCWGVYPASNGNIYASDIQGGLFVLRTNESGEPPVEFQLAAPQAQVANPGQPQSFWFDLYNSSTRRLTFLLAATHSMGWTVNVAPSVVVPNGGVEGVQVTVQVPTDVTMPTRSEVELCATPSGSDATRCAHTGIAVPVVLQALEAEAAPDGIHLRWRLTHDAGESGSLQVLRAVVIAPEAEPGAFESRARLDWGTTGWLDADVEGGVSYVYRLCLVNGAEARILGETRVAAPAPSRSRLLGAAPNPFNPTTRIRFELARAGAVEIAIHDARGRLVRRLAVADLEPGEHALAWDGRDAHGLAQPSGVYLYEIRSGAWTARGRMTLAK